MDFRYFATKWSSCSTTCGPGILRRSLSCKVFLPYIGTVVDISMAKCAGTYVKSTPN